VALIHRACQRQQARAQAADTQMPGEKASRLSYRVLGGRSLPALCVSCACAVLICARMPLVRGLDTQPRRRKGLAETTGVDAASLFFFCLLSARPGCASCIPGTRHVTRHSESARRD
jgi:hypothetical protein